ncbi:hypothetical protein SAMN05444365_101749 [Micromonospora pattaloongensis]|uniref:Uncharacterized protein n=1 Tax=Micromonospora pattaloongensis TaxID=405436 RepID=A0A1H3HB12_9ACTN|nr:hypothetical protein [Micromonospora pattaloongensis]SDY12405.1 hypothetical protein SAMN05444365_101749 [Micromonospora pattaloongensis]
MTAGQELDAAWRDYLEAAQQLGAAQQSAAAQQDTAAQQGAADVPGEPAQGAREELVRVDARLAPQRSRLREAGVPEPMLTPTPSEIAAAAQTMTAGPPAVLAALRQARITADAADAVLIGTAPLPPREVPPWRRNLLVYGPFALVVLVVQLGLVIAAGGRAQAGALLCGLAMPVAAFALGWLTVGLVFRSAPAGRVDRTALLGAAVCAAPLLVTAAALASRTT